MNEPDDFNKDYLVLKLSNSANWKSARAKYQKLVHIWHPDRYADKPRERQQAQKQFIALTKSYNNLKEFQRLHGRLPFENIDRQEDRPDAELNSSHDEPTKTAGEVKRNDLDSSTLARDDDDDPDKGRWLPHSTRKIIWGLTACIVIFSTIVLFFILDKKTNQQARQRGQQVLREAPQSEFIPTPEEIRRARSKGVFIADPK